MSNRPLSNAASDCLSESSQFDPKQEYKNIKQGVPQPKLGPGGKAYEEGSYEQKYL